MSSLAKHFQPFMMAEERAARSVFVGNIPYEATEEQLKEIFCQAGPVVSFRLVYDRETGKPKGYGFCEYQDIETAQSAMRNLNNHDFSGRPLRVGVAAGEQTKEDNRTMQQALGGPVSESPYGEPVDPDKAPEAISRAVASLPPEQMFELMKQMKLCIQNNPNEARNMLLQNPQLAYALLQAQIVMKIVDPQVALAMLHRQTEQIPPVMPSSCGTTIDTQSISSIALMDSRSGNMFPGSRHGLSTNSPIGINTASSSAVGLTDHGIVHLDGKEMHQVDLQQSNLSDCRITSSLERREMVPVDRRELASKSLHGVVGDPHGQFPPDTSVIGLKSRNDDMKTDFTSKISANVRPEIITNISQRQDMTRMGPGLIGPRHDMSLVIRSDVLGSFKGPIRDNEPAVGSRMIFNPDARDPRQAAEIRRNVLNQGSVARMKMPTVDSPVSAASSAVTHDHEKAALIMQVLQLSDEQIALLPVDQRQSILILKEQIARSAGQGES